MTPLNRAGIGALALAALASAPAHATALTSLEVLQQFNLVVLGDLDSNNHVHGRTYVGGDVRGDSFAEFGEDASIPTSIYAGTTVRGNIVNFGANNKGLAAQGRVDSGRVNSGASLVLGDVSQVSFNALAYVGGTASGVNFNGGRAGAIDGNAVLSGYRSSLSSTDFRSVMSDASQAIRSLGSNSTAVRQGSRLVFNAKPDASGVAVFNIDNFDGITEFSFNLGSDTRSVYINSGLRSADLAINFLAGSAQSLGNRLIWNFYAAQSLNFGTQWGGTILATSADVRNSNDLEGTLIAGSATLRGEVHQNPFTGTLPTVNTIPEAPGWALVGTGLLGVALSRRKLRRG